MAYTGDKKRSYQVAWLTARRAAWIESKGGVCASCGSADRLEIDHINRSDKSMQPTAIWSRSRAIREAELAKCQVLCYDCHRTKTITESSTAKCGQIGMYNKGCRCELCKEANRLRVRKYRASKIKTMPQ